MPGDGDDVGEPPGPFVDAAWVLDHLDDIVLADVRWSLDGSEGEHTYLARHLPGAVHVDLDQVLAATPSRSHGRHPLPAPEPFAADLGALGIGDDRVVVAYDQGPGAMAARLVWCLRAIGQSAAVLEGGLAAWQGPTETGRVVREPEERRTVPWPTERIIGTDELLQRHEAADLLVLDARDPARYAGDTEPVDARAGHVPGARNAPFTANLDGVVLRSRDELRDRYASLGAFEAAEVVAYCGSGVTACHDVLVLEHLGVRARLYPGSWSAWAADPSRPIATGADADDLAG